MELNEKRLTGEGEIGPITQRRDGQPIHPGDGIVPILKEIAVKHLAVVGTGFYVTRYGLLVTAKHVAEALATKDGAALALSFVCHLGTESTIYLRQIRRAFLLRAADVAVVQADNYIEKCPLDPLMNLRATLSTTLPPENAALITYAYPENKVLDFTNESQVPEIRGDYFEGGFLRFVEQPENPLLRFPYFETTIGLRPGASGGPVFYEGKIIGVNCAGWSFQGAEHEGHSLSYIVPIQHLLDLEVDPFMVPPHSWEAQQIPEFRRGQILSVRELAQYGHILLDTPLT